MAVFGRMLRRECCVEDWKLLTTNIKPKSELMVECGDLMWCPKESYLGLQMAIREGDLM